jgi:hypothetical protein
MRLPGVESALDCRWAKGEGVGRVAEGRGSRPVVALGSFAADRLVSSTSHPPRATMPSEGARGALPQVGVRRRRERARSGCKETTAERRTTRAWLRISNRASRMTTSATSEHSVQSRSARGAMTSLRATPTFLTGFCLGAICVIAASPLIAVGVLALLAGAYRLAAVVRPQRGGNATLADQDVSHGRLDVSHGRLLRVLDSRRPVFDREEDVCGSEFPGASMLIGRSSAVGRWLLSRPWGVVRAARRTRR